MPQERSQQPSRKHTPLRMRSGFAVAAIVGTALGLASPASARSTGFAAGLAADADPYRRLGDDARLAQIREAETRPFPFETLAGLPGWRGEPLDEDTVNGRVLVLLAWDQADPKSVRLLPTLARLQRVMEDDIVCVAVHAEEGWAEAAERIEAGRVPIPTAHDASGELFEALTADEHPNLYLVDRAGRVRMADLDSRDLSKAVRELTRETPEQAAADLPRRIELSAETRALVPASGDPNSTDPAPGNPADGRAPGSDPARTDRPGRAPGSRPQPGARPDPASIPAQFRGLGRPDESAYQAAEWPDHNTGRLNADDYQGKQLPVPLGEENWLTPFPDGQVRDRVIVLDFWATWCPPCIQASPIFDRLQRENQGELVVLAIAGQAQPGLPEDENTIRNYIRRHRVSYSHAHDPEQKVYRSLKINAIPHAVVLSTDGTVRWQGNPLAAEFPGVVRKVIESDPLLAARRAQAQRQQDGKEGGQKEGESKPDAPARPGRP